MACGPRVPSAPVAAFDPAGVGPDDAILQAYARAGLAIAHGDRSAAEEAVRLLEALDDGGPWGPAALARLYVRLERAADAGRAWCRAAERGAPDEVLVEAAAVLREGGVGPVPCEAWRAFDDGVTPPAGPDAGPVEPASARPWR